MANREKAKVIINQGIKPESISAISKRKLSVNREYGIDDRFSTDEPLSYAFRIKLNIRIAKSFLNSLESKGNLTAMKIKNGENLPFNEEDILGVVNMAMCEHADELQLDGDTLIVNNLVLECFRACSNHMYNQGSRHVTQDSIDRIINECLHSTEWEDGVISEDTETGESFAQAQAPIINYDIQVIEDYIRVHFKEETATELVMFFQYRLYGYRKIDIERATGLTHDRVKYLNKLLKNVGLALGYVEPDYIPVYQVKRVKKHSIRLNGKEYQVVSVNPVKRVIYNPVGRIINNPDIVSARIIQGNKDGRKYIQGDNFIMYPVKTGKRIELETEKGRFTESPFERFTVVTHEYREKPVKRMGKIRRPDGSVYMVEYETIEREKVRVVNPIIK